MHTGPIPKTNETTTQFAERIDAALTRAEPRIWFRLAPGWLEPRRTLGAWTTQDLADAAARGGITLAHPEAEVRSGPAGFHLAVQQSADIRARGVVVP
jgi:hypothetical protein